MRIKIIIKYLIKYIKLAFNKIYSFYFICKMRSLNCKIKYNVNLNINTKLEGKTIIHKHSNIENSKIGLGSYIGRNCMLANCEIGRFSSISSFVEVIYGRHPISNFVSTHPAFFSIQKQGGFTFVNSNLFNECKFADVDRKLSVSIGNDVWIGQGAKILEGVTIGDGAVIGAGAIVTKDVAPYSIVGGIPAKVIKFRFSKEDIDFLLSFKWWNRDQEWIKTNAKYFFDIKAFIEVWNTN